MTLSAENLATLASVEVQHTTEDHVDTPTQASGKEKKQRVERPLDIMEVSDCLGLFHTVKGPDGELDVVPYGNVYRFVLTEQNRSRDTRTPIANLKHLFDSMANAMRRYTGSDRWTVRYCSQIMNQNFPFVYNGDQRISLVDPMMGVHNPIFSLLKVGYIDLQELHSQTHHMKNLQHVQNCKIADRSGRWPVDPVSYELRPGVAGMSK